MNKNEFCENGYWHFVNRRCSRAGDYPRRLHAFLPPAMTDAAAAEIQRWRGYRPSPLIALGAAAKKAGVARVFYKDESSRFGVGSFKALGGGYAVGIALRDALQKAGVKDCDVFSGDFSRRALAAAGKVTVAAATDGNHGRAVAWAAQKFGCRCRIYLHENVSAGRQRAIEKYGAIAVRVAGNYDDSLRAAAKDARREGWTIVSDTVCGNLRRLPRFVMAGYGLMIDEALAQLPRGVLPSHVFVQGGVGGLAAALCARLWQKLGARRGRFVVAEPTLAACLFASARAGKPQSVALEKETVMAGLSCGEVSRLAFPILLAGANDFAAVPEDCVAPAMRFLHCNKPRVVAGESAVAGLALLFAAARGGELRRRLGLTASSRVLLFGTEGATDLRIYRGMIGG